MQSPPVIKWNNSRALVLIADLHDSSRTLVPPKTSGAAIEPSAWRTDLPASFLDRHTGPEAVENTEIDESPPVAPRVRRDDDVCAALVVHKLGNTVPLVISLHSSRFWTEVRATGPEAHDGRYRYCTPVNHFKHLFCHCSPNGPGGVSSAPKRPAHCSSHVLLVGHSTPLLSSSKSEG